MLITWVNWVNKGKTCSVWVNYICLFFGLQGNILRRQSGNQKQTCFQRTEAHRKQSLSFLFLLPNCQINDRPWKITRKCVSFSFQKRTDLGHVLCNCGQRSFICQKQIEFPESWIRYATHLLSSAYINLYSSIYLLTFVNYIDQKHWVFCFSGFWSVQKSSHNCWCHYFLTSFLTS